MAKLVANRYASALFQAGMDLEKIKQFNEELDFIESVFSGEEKLLQILDHPKIRESEKRELIDSLFKERLSEEMINFLYILIDKRRQGYILEIVQEYRLLFNKHENIIKVVAITAVPMEDKAKDKLILVLKDKLKKTIELTNEIDKKLIGGVLLKVEDKLIDGTVKGQLESIGRVIQGATN